MAEADQCQYHRHFDADREDSQASSDRTVPQVFEDEFIDQGSPFSVKDRRALFKLFV